MKRVPTGLLCLILIFSLTGCYDAKHIERTVAVLAVGIDKGENGQKKISFHLDLPSSSGSEEEGESSSGSEPKILTIKAPTVLSALQRANDITSANVDLSHVKMLVFSEDIAKEGIKDILDELMRSYRFQNNAYTVVAKSSAEEVLKKVKPEEETYTSVYYQTILQKQYTNTRKDFLAYQVYFNVTDENPHALTLPLMSTAEDDKVSFSGSAVFSGDKMIGTLSEDEELANSILNGVMQRRSFSIADPKDENNPIVLLLTQNDKPQTKAEIKDGKIYVNIKISLTGLYQTRENDGEDDKAFCQYLQNYIEDTCQKLLERTTREFGIDLCRAQDKLKRSFLTDKNWEEFNFNARLKEAEYKVEVNVQLPQANSFKEV